MWIGHTLVLCCQLLPNNSKLLATVLQEIASGLRSKSQRCASPAKVITSSVEVA